MKFIKDVIQAIVTKNTFILFAAIISEIWLFIIDWRIGICIFFICWLQNHYVKFIIEEGATKE